VAAESDLKLIALATTSGYIQGMNNRIKYSSACSAIKALPVAFAEIRPRFPGCKKKGRDFRPGLVYLDHSTS